MKVLSLFDGISAGRVALDRTGIKVDIYYRSEIDKFANQVAMHHFPDDVQLGDVTKWREWSIDWSSIDLLIGGSPCQGFSFAGKQLAFDDPRSKLFFVYVDILNHIKYLNPNVKFMLENVKMKKDYLDVISERLGVQPILINSALVSAQNRQRYYWFNWKADIPIDKEIVLRDIIDPSPYFYPRPCTRVKDGNSGHIAEATDIKGMDCIKRVYGDNGKSPTLTTMTGGHRQPKVVVGGAICGRYSPQGKVEQQIEIRKDEKNNTLTAVQKESLIVGKLILVNQSTTRDSKSYTLTASYSGAVAWNSIERKQRTMVPARLSNEESPNNYGGIVYRKLTPIECERLQTFPDNYTAMVSNTQRYKALGNSWTVDVVAHIFSSMSHSAN